MSQVLTLSLIATVLAVYWRGIALLVEHSAAWPGSGHHPIGMPGVFGFLTTAVVLALLFVAVSLAPRFFRGRPLESRRVLVRLAIALIFTGAVVLWMIPKII